MTMATNTHLLNCPPLRFPEFSDPWQTTILGEVAEIKKGSGISKDQLSLQGNPCILYGELYTTYSSEVIREIRSHTEINPSTLILSQAGDVIIPSSGETAIDIAVARCVLVNNVALGGDLNVIRSLTTDGRFLAYLLNGPKKREIAEFAQGIAVVHLYGRDLSKLNISLPSIAEQRKIAEFLSLIDERIETQRQTIEERKKQKKALLHQIFSQSLRFPNFSAPWQQTTLGEVCTIKTGKLDANAMVENGSYPFFTCAKHTYQTDTYSFSGEAILIAGNGEVGLTKYYNGKFNAYQRTYVLQSFRSDIILLFIRNHIDYALPKRIISFLNGSAMPYITLRTLTDMPISLPSLPEQRKITELLAIFDERIEAEEALLKCYESQKRYLLRQMFA